jgi:two-component system, cell cycle sensor histidine kinase and response regulator CckA
MKERGGGYEIMKMAIVSFLFLGMALISSAGLSQVRAAEKFQPTNPVSPPSTSLKTIIVGDYYPYTFVNDKGVPDGFSVDIAKAVTHVMDLRLEIHADTWEHATEALSGGAIDLLPMMARSPARDKLFDFSVPHTIAYDAVFLRNGGKKISSLEDLTDKTVIVMSKDVAHQYLLSSGRAGRMKLILVDSLPDALQALAAGKGDAVLMPKLVGLIIMNKLNLTNLDQHPIVIEAYNRPFCFAVTHGNQALLERLSQGLSIIKSTGQYEEIYNKWFGALEPPGLSWKTVIKYIAVTVVVFLLIAMGLILWNLSLRKQVSLRTKNLTAEIQERKRTEQALYESNDRLKLTLSAAKAGTWEWDLRTDENIWSEELWPLYGLAPHNDKPSYELWLQSIHPDDRDLTSSIVGNAARAGDDLNIEWRVNNPGGPERWLMSRGRPEHDEHDRVIRYLGIVIDITDRKQTEAALRQSEANLSRAQEIAHLGSWEYDSETGKIIWSDEAYRIFGFTPKETEITSDLLLNMTHPADRDKVGNGLSDIQDRPAQYDIEYRIIRRDGSVRQVHSKRYISIEKAGPGKIFGMVQDITDRKRGEQETEILADIGRLISSTLEIDEVYERVASETRKLIPFDSLMVNLKKQEENELIISYVSGLDIPARKKGDRIPFKGSLSEVVICTRKGMLIQSESEEIVKKFPHLIHVIQAGLISTISVPLISSDKVIGVLVFRSKTRAAYTQKDLLLAEKIGTQIAGAIANAQLYKELRETEKSLRESEGKFRLLVEHSPDPIYVQIHGCFAYLNPAAVHFYGAESDKELLGCPILGRVHPDYQETVRERMRLLNVERNEVALMEQKYLRLDGSVIDVEISAVPIRYNDTDGALTFVRDVSERKQMERQAARTEKLEAIGTLAAGIAHDFNNLLGAMFGYLELSKEEAEKDHQKKIVEHLSKAFDSFERAKSLTEQLLTFTKGGTPARTTQSLSDLVRKVVSFSLSGSNVTPVFGIPEGIWLCSFDKNQVSQVIESVIINAGQAMPEGGAIEVSVVNISAEDILENYPKQDYVRISIHDNGTGISPEQLPRIFDPFFSTKKMGSGLGLATAYSITRQHDGFIEVESQPGEGSTFHIYLPASQEQIPLPVEEKSQKQHHGKAKILIMDDEELICSALELMLKGMGYSAVATRNSKETAEAVLEALNAGKPFVAAILDLTIPGGPGGKEIIGDLQKLDPDIKVIASSGYADNPVMSRPSDYGFTASLRKPYRRDDLSKVLDALIPSV